MKFEQELGNTLMRNGYSQDNAEKIAKEMSPKLNSTCNLLQQVLDRNINILTIDSRYDSNNDAEQVLIDLILDDCESINSFKHNLDGLNRYIRLSREYLVDGSSVNGSSLYLFSNEVSIIASVLVDDDDFDAVMALLKDAFMTFSSDYANKLQKVKETVFYTTVYSYCCGVHNHS